jgi:hypothetical protein
MILPRWTRTRTLSRDGMCGSSLTGGARETNTQYSRPTRLRSTTKRTQRSTSRRLRRRRSPFACAAAVRRASEFRSTHFPYRLMLSMLGAIAQLRRYELVPRICGYEWRDALPFNLQVRARPPPRCVSASKPRVAASDGKLPKPPPQTSRAETSETSPQTSRAETS